MEVGERKNLCACLNTFLRSARAFAVGARPARPRDDPANNHVLETSGGKSHAAFTQSDCERRRKSQRSIFEIIYRRSVPRLGHNQAIGVIAHRQCRLIWLMLHQGARYEERAQQSANNPDISAPGE
jgi:hypothetical protein